jgi:hypothetical protein
MLLTRAFALVCVAAVLLGVAGCKIDPPAAAGASSAGPAGGPQTVSGPIPLVAW